MRIAAHVANTYARPDCFEFDADALKSVALLPMVKALPKYDAARNKSFEGWLFTVGRLAVIDHLRSVRGRTGERLKTQTLDGIDVPRNPPDADLAIDVRDALAGLPPKLRKLCGRIMAGDTLREACKAAGVAESTWQGHDRLRVLRALRGRYVRHQTRDELWAIRKERHRHRRAIYAEIAACKEKLREVR